MTPDMYKEVYHAMIAIHGSDFHIQECLELPTTLPISYNMGNPITFRKSIYSRMVSCLTEHIQDKDRSIAGKSQHALHKLGEI